MDLNPEQLDALDQAEPLILKRDYSKYLRLKELLPQQNESNQVEFRRVFKSYYGLNTARLGDQFLNAFFEALFQWNKGMDAAALLKKLYQIPTERGRNTLQLSFVSKLMAIHDESRPIYDKHVRSFFAVSEIGTKKPIDERIAWWIAFLDGVKAAYERWVTSEEVTRILNRLCKRVPELAACNPVRLLDFLVWKIGNASLIEKVRQKRELQLLVSEIEAVASVQGRINLVAGDYHSGDYRYSEIDAWKLAELVGLDFSDNGDWERTIWGLKRVFSEAPWCWHPYAENIHYLEDRISSDRFQELLGFAEEIQNCERDDDLPLTQEEIKLLEEAYSGEPPEFSHFEYITKTLYATNEDPIHFTAMVGDTGEIEDAKSPYDVGNEPGFDPEDEYIQMY
jgi:hypothetical protein